MTASDTAISAGWAFSVSVSSSSGPSHISRGELLAQRLIDLVEHGARLREGLRQRLAHADGLAALARKNEGCRHCRSFRKTGPNGPNIGETVKLTADRAARNLK